MTVCKLPISDGPWTIPENCLGEVLAGTSKLCQSLCHKFSNVNLCSIMQYPYLLTVVNAAFEFANQAKDKRGQAILSPSVLLHNV